MIPKTKIIEIFDRLLYIFQYQAGFCQIDMIELKRIEKFLEANLKNSIDLENTYTCYSILHAIKNNEDKAIEWIDKTIKLWPNSARSYVNYSEILLYFGHIQQAIEVLQLGVKRLATNEALISKLFSIAWFYADIDMYMLYSKESKPEIKRFFMELEEFLNAQQIKSAEIKKAIQLAFDIMRLHNVKVKQGRSNFIIDPDDGSKDFVCDLVLYADKPTSDKINDNFMIKTIAMDFSKAFHSHTVFRFSPSIEIMNAN